MKYSTLKNFGNLKINKDNLLGVYSPKFISKKIDFDKLLKNSLKKSIGKPPLKDYVKGKNSVLILIDDITRTTPIKKILPYVLENLRKGGIKKNNITIIIAYGTHRKMTDKEKKDRIGEEIYKEYIVTDHEWKDKNSLIKVGETISKIPIVVNKKVLDTDVVIGIGQINPHRGVGYSGGAKILFPGVCGSDTVGKLHWEAAKLRSEDLLGVYPNSISKQINYAAGLAGLDYIVNVIEDSSGECVDIVCGDFEKAHQKGIEVAKKIFEVFIPQKADIVIFDSYPADIDFWQAAKALYAASLAVKDGGTLIMKTLCYEGISGTHANIIMKHGCQTIDKVQKLINNNSINDLVVAAVMIWISQITMQKAQCLIISEGLNEAQCIALGCKKISDLDNALNISLKKHGDSSKIVVFSKLTKSYPKIAN